MQNSSPTLEQLFLEIQGLKKEVETLRLKRGKDAHHIEQLTNDFARLKRDTDYLHKLRDKDAIFQHNVIADIHLLLTELSKQHMPQLMNFECDVQDITGVPDFKAPERFKRAPKMPTEKTSN